MEIDGTEKGNRMPDGRPILQPPGVSLREAARRLQVPLEQVKAWALEGRLSTYAEGTMIPITSVAKVQREVAAEERRRRETSLRDARTAQIERELAASRRAAPARGYRQPKEGISGRVASAGLPTLGKRR